MEDEITALEEGFWAASFAGDGDYFDTHLSEDALLVFPEPAGLLEKAECVRIIAESPPRETRWSISETRVLPLGDGAVALTYRGVAELVAEGTTERDRRTSVYRRDDGRWRLALHHVTNEPEPSD